MCRYLGKDIRKVLWKYEENQVNPGWFWIVEALQESTAILSFGEASAKQAFPEIGFRADVTAKLKELCSSAKPTCTPNPNPNSYGCLLEHSAFISHYYT